jgi:hypothetical protein
MARLILIVYLSLLSISYSSAQCGLYEVPLQERINHSSIIVEGKVVVQNSFKDSATGKILTSNLIEVYKLFRGEKNDYVEVLTEGGVLDDEMMIASNLLQLQIDDYGIFLLKETPKGAIQAVASKQGFVKFFWPQLSARDVFAKYADIETDLYQKISFNASYKEIRSADFLYDQDDQQENLRSTPIITSISPTVIAAGTGEVITIRGINFKAVRGSNRLGFRDADDGGDSFVFPLPHQYKRWTDTEIEVEVPTNAGSGNLFISVDNLSSQSTATIEIPFSRMNVVSDNTAFRHVLVSRSPHGGYLLQMNRRFAQNQASSESFLRAFNNWRCNVGVNWFIGEETDTDLAVRDNVNVIRFDIGAELPSGVLGVCYSYYSGCRPSSWYLSEMDIVFDGQANWQFGPGLPGTLQHDFESIALHELGHGLQLGHVINSSDVMHYKYNRGQSNRELNERNILAASIIIEESTQKTVCEAFPMHLISKEICEISDIDEFTFTGFLYGPNPVSSSLMVKYNLDRATTISMVLYDVTGKRIANLVNEQKHLGSYRHDFNLNQLNLSNGLYFLRIIRNTEVEVIKLFLE